MKTIRIARNSQVFQSVMVFLVAFGLNQISMYLSSINLSLIWLRSLTFFIIAMVLFLFMRFTSSNFKKHGFFSPKNSGRLLALSLFLAFLYILIVLFVPGALSEFEALPTLPISWDTLFTIGSVLLATIATVAVFQGYIQTNVTNAYGFSIAVVAVTAMFTLFSFPVTMFFTIDPAILFRQILLLAAQSVFICFFFMETETVLTPIVFTAAASLLAIFTPLQATSTDDVTLFSVMLYVLLVPIMHSFVEEVKQQNLRESPMPILEPAEES
jgi:hypothetical protein